VIKMQQCSHIHSLFGARLPLESFAGRHPIANLLESTFVLAVLSKMISSATLFLATLALHFTVVLGAPISTIAPRALENTGFSVRLARDESFPEAVPTFVKRAITDAFPIVKRETEDIVRRYPRRFIYEHLEKRGTTVHEKVTVVEKTIKHDTPADTVAYNNGQPINNNGNTGGNGDGTIGGFTTSIGFSTTIEVPGVPTPTPTSTSTSSAAPTPVPTAAPGPAPPAANGGVPGAPSSTTTATGTSTTATPSPTPDQPKPIDGTTTTTDGAPKPTDGTTTTTDGTPKPTDGTTTTTDGTTTTPNPAAPAPDGTNTTTTPGTVDPNATGGDPNAAGGNAGGENKDATDGLVQPSKRELAMSGAVLASSLRRRAL